MLAKFIFALIAGIFFFSYSHPQEEETPAGFTGDVLSFDGWGSRVTVGEQGVSGGVQTSSRKSMWYEDDVFLLVEFGAGINRLEGKDITRATTELDVDIEFTQHFPKRDLYFSIGHMQDWSFPIAGLTDSRREDLHPETPTHESSSRLAFGLLQKNQHNGDFWSVGLCADIMFRSEDIDLQGDAGSDCQAGVAAEFYRTTKKGRKVHGEFEVGVYANDFNGDAYSNLGFRYQSDHWSVFAGLGHDDRGLILGEFGKDNITPTVRFDAGF